MISTKNNTSGFSLIEIILALLVVAVGITAMLGLLGSTLDSSSKSRGDIHVVSFADMVLNFCHSQTEWNTIQTKGYLSLPDYFGNTTQLSLNSVSQFTLTAPGNDDSEPQDIYTVTYDLNIEQDNQSSNVKSVHLKVWSGFSTNSLPRLFYTEIYNWADK